MKLETLFIAIRELISSRSGDSDTSIDEKEALTRRLSRNLASYRVLLKGSRFNELSEVLYAHRTDTKLSHNENSTLAIYEDFTSEATALVGALDDHLRSLHEEDQRAAIAMATSGIAVPPETPLPPPSALLSVGDVKTLHSLLEFVVSLGVYPYLLHEADAFLRLRVSHVTSVTKANGLPLDMGPSLLHAPCATIAKTFQNKVIGPALLTRHLADVLVGLLQICYGPMPSRRSCPAKLRGIGCHGDITSPTKVTDPAQVTNITSPAKVTDITSPAKVTDITSPAQVTDITSPAQVTGREALSGQPLPQIPPQAPVHISSQQLLDELLSGTHQPLVVKALLVLQGMSLAKGTQKPHGTDPIQSNGSSKASSPRTSGSPKWLHMVCGELLSATLMRKNGVHHVISGVMEATAGAATGQDWKKCKAIARVLSSCPSQVASLEDYYSLVCPQLLDLLHSKSSSHTHFRVALETISTLSSQNKGLAKQYIFHPLTSSLTLMLGGECTITPAKVHEIETCLYDLRKITIAVVSPSPILLGLFSFAPILFQVWREDLKHTKLSGHSKDVLERLLRAASRQDLISFLCLVCNIPAPSSPVTPPPGAPYPDFKALQPSLVLTTCASDHSPSSPALTCSGGPPCAPLSGHSPPSLAIVGVSDSQAVLGMESTSRCVVTLLTSSTLNSDPELVGEFFIHCLKHLVAILSCPSHAHSGHAHSGHAHSGHTHTGDNVSSSLLLECEDTLPLSVAEVTSRAAILHTTAALCEHMGDHVIHHAHLPSLLGACADIITCHAHSLEAGREVRLEVKEEVMMGGSVSLNIVFGLLSAVMAGARKVDHTHRQHLNAMTEPLLTISTLFPDAEVSSLAGDLRVCIATLGAVWSKDMRTCASTFQAGKRATGSNVPPLHQGDNTASSRSREDTAVPTDGGVGEDSRGPSGEGSRGPSGEGSRGPSGEGSRGPSGEGSRGPSGEGSRGPSGEGSRGPSGEGSRGPSGEGSRGPSGEGSRGPSGEGSRGPSGEDSRGPSGEGSRGPSGEDSRGCDLSSFRVALNELTDPLIPVRGHGLIVLTQLVKSKDVETLHNAGILMQVFRENLSHSDSYVYLPAINGLVALALSVPSVAEMALTTLCQEYACLSGRPQAQLRSKYNTDTGQLVSDTPLIQTAGDTPLSQTSEARPLIQTTEATPLIQTSEATPLSQTTEAMPLIQTTEDTPLIQSEATPLIQTKAAPLIQTEATPLQRSLDVETRLKLGEALVRVSHELQDMLPCYLEDILAALLTTVRDTDPMLRVSSLTNIAEICAAGKLGLTSVVNEILSCVKHVLWSDHEVKVRQAALVVLKHMIKSISIQNGSEQLLDMYRVLKLVEEQPHQDDLTRAHAQAALGELDTVVRTYMFPQGRKLEKKITVLSSS